MRRASNGLTAVRSTNPRVGVLILAIGLAAGSLFGPTLASAADNFKAVFVTNTATDPVPVSGTVNVGNLPATQPVSGTVNVGSMPTPVPISDGVTQSGTIPPGGSTLVSISSSDQNLVAAAFWSDALARMIIDSDGGVVGNGYQLVAPGDQSVVQSFVNPLPASSVTVTCDISNATPCRYRWAVATI